MSNSKYKKLGVISMIKFVQDNKVVLGYVPIKRDSFPLSTSVPVRDAVRERVEAILSNIIDVELVTIDDIVDNGMLCDTRDVAKVVDYFTAKKVDAVFFPHCNFGQEEVVAKVAFGLKKPVLLWGPRDPDPETSGGAESVGPRAWDTQCGLFATARALSRWGVPFTYIENCWVDSPLLESGIDNFIRVAAVVKAFRGMRVAQFGMRPRQFHSVTINESELLSKFDIEIVPVWLDEATNMVEKLRKGIPASPSGSEMRKPSESEGTGIADERIKTIMDELRDSLDIENVTDEVLEKIAVLQIAFMDLCKVNLCTAMALDCWAYTNNNFNVAACFILGDLFDRNLPAACETDIHAAIAARMLQAASRGQTAPFIADVTIRHPHNDNAELLWHCGPFAKSLKKEGVSGRIVEGRGTYELKGGPITVVRFDQDDNGNYMLFADEGVGVDGPRTGGNYVWLETKDWPKWEKKLIYGPYIHHITGAHGNYAAVLKESCKYLGLTHDSVEEIEYV